MTEPGDALSFDLVAAALRSDSADVAVYARVLTDSLGDALPEGTVVEPVDLPQQSPDPNPRKDTEKDKVTNSKRKS